MQLSWRNMPLLMACFAMQHTLPGLILLNAMRAYVRVYECASVPSTLQANSACMPPLLHSNAPARPCSVASTTATEADACFTWLLGHLVVVGGPLQVGRPVKGDGMLFQDDGRVCCRLDAVQNHRFASFKPESHVLLPEADQGSNAMQLACLSWGLDPAQHPLQPMQHAYFRQRLLKFGRPVNAGWLG